ncbi:MAG: transposase [Cyanobacteria bacterium P01_F01_bin.116]
MSIAPIHTCQCPECQAGGDGVLPELHRQMNVFLSRLNEQQRRWYAAIEAKRLGHGGIKRLSQITGLDVNTIRRGRDELSENLQGRPVSRVRVAGGGRKPLEKKA